MISLFILSPFFNLVRTLRANNNPGSRGLSGGMQCGHSAQRGNFFPSVKHKANLSLGVILFTKFNKSYTASSTAA
jgi:hypothetical protein